MKFIKSTGKKVLAFVKDNRWHLTYAILLMQLVLFYVYYKYDIFPEEKFLQAKTTIPNLWTALNFTDMGNYALINLDATPF